MRFISLKTKITFLTVLLSTLTTGVLGSYLVYKSYQALRDQAQQAQLVLAKTLAWQVETGLSRAFSAIELFSRRPETISLQKQDLVREMTLVTTSTELIDTMLLYRPDGRLFAKALAAFEEKNLPPRTFLKENYARARELRGSILVTAYKTQEGNVGVAISTPVFQGDRFVGVLVGILYLPNHTIGNLNTARIGMTGYAFLVNQDGICIVHPDRYRLLENLSSYPPVRALKSQKEGIIQYTDKLEVSTLGAFATVKSASWGVVVREPAGECFAPADRMLRFMSFFLMIALIVTIALALTLSQRFVQPILQLSKEVGQYDSGRLDIKKLTSLSPTDEVQVLGLAIGKMAQRIKTQTREREKAYARTLRVERKLAESERLATIGQFSAGLAHELNNPIAVILGAAGLAKETTGKKQRQWLLEIQREADRCRRLVADLLNFAKPLTLKIRKEDLGDLVQDTWGQIGADPGKYTFKVNKSSFHAMVDRDRFKQVLVNVLRNAVEAMPKGGRILADLKRVKNTNRLTISDDGLGILKKNEGQIFRPFFTTKPTGTGLGLALCRSILSAHGGQIRIEPNKPRGAKIIMEWPDTRSLDRSGEKYDS